MEGSPLPVDDDSEKGSETNKSKKKAKKIGLFLVESKPDKPETKPKTPQPERPWLKTVEPEESVKDKKSELDPLADESEIETEKIEEQPSTEAEAPLETVSETEKPEVESQLVQVIREIEAERAPDPDTDPAVEYFRELVIAGEDSETAYEEVMTELGAEEADLVAVEDHVEPDQESMEELRISHMPEASDDEEPEVSVPAGGGAAPPSSPQSPFGPGGPTPPRRNNRNLMPPPAATDKESQTPEYRQAHPAALALLGGVVGYLIGRRRGRIRAEKKLLPVQKKLEKQVEDMQWQLQIKEKQIRKVAAEKVRHDGPLVIEAIKSKVVEKPALKPEESLATVRRRAPEAHQLHGSQPRHEHIGQVLVAASETNTTKAPKGSPETGQAEKQVEARKLSEQLQGRRVDTLNRAELLNLSDKIIVEGSSLRQIYETHLIGERGLRRLVNEHLRGGDIKKALQAEIVEREIDFERDPAMRDMAQAGSGGADGAGKATLNKLIEKASEQVAGSEEAAFFRARANYEAEQIDQQQKQRRLVDVSLTAAIALLIAIVIFLILRRG